MMSCDRLAKNHSLLEPPFSTSMATSSNTVASGLLAIRK